MFWILTNYKVYLESQNIQNTQYNIRYEKKVGKLTLPETYNGFIIINNIPPPIPQIIIPSVQFSRSVVSDFL